MTGLLTAFALRHLKSILVVAAVLAVLGTVYGWHRVQVHQAYARGQTEERAAWEKRVAAERYARDQERRAAQVKVDEQAAEFQEMERQLLEAQAARNAAEDRLVREGVGAGIVVPDAWLDQLRSVGR